MTDITKCSGEGCPVRTACDRYTTRPGQYPQPWMAPPGRYVDGLWVCEMALTAERFGKP
jgi:hypothetical protein